MSLIQTRATKRKLRDFDDAPDKTETKLYKTCISDLKEDKQLSALCNEILYRNETLSNVVKVLVNKHLGKYGVLNTPYGQLVSILFLMARHQNDCYIINADPYELISEQYLTNSSIEYQEIEIDFLTYKDENNKRYTEITNISFPNNFRDNFNRCENKKKRFIFIMIGIYHNSKEYYDTNQNKYIENKEFIPTGHQNALIFDMVKKTVERYDPHGDIKEGTFYDYDDFDNQFSKELVKQIPLIEKFKYIGPQALCPTFEGFQAIEDSENAKSRLDYNGYCYIWSLFYMDLRLTNRNLTSKQVIKISLKQINDIKFKEFIYNYLTFFSHIFEQISKVLQEIKKINKTDSEYKSLLENKAKDIIHRFATIYTTGVDIYEHEEKTKPTRLQRFKKWLKKFTKSNKIPNVIDEDILKKTFLNFPTISQPDLKKRRIDKGGRKGTLKKKCKGKTLKGKKCKNKVKGKKKYCNKHSKK